MLGRRSRSAAGRAHEVDDPRREGIEVPAEAQPGLQTCDAGIGGHLLDVPAVDTREQAVDRLVEQARALRRLEVELHGLRAGTPGLGTAVAVTSLGTPGTGQASLTWTASTDNVGIDHYELSKDGAFVKNVTGTSTAVSLSCGVTSSFTVVAKDAAGNAATSAAKSIAGAACSTPGDTTNPSAPSGLAASNVTQNGATLSWTAATDNVGVDHYVVYKNAVNSGQLTGTSTSVTLSCGAASTFTVAAFDAAGKSQIITLANPWVIAYAAKDGAEIWRAECLDGERSP